MGTQKHDEEAKAAVSEGIYATCIDTRLSIILALGKGVEVLGGFAGGEFLAGFAGSGFAGGEVVRGDNLKPLTELLE